MHEPHYRLGTLDASEAVITDLYLKLRKELFRWSYVTHQTPQPRMGYVGQHLTSVVTGYPGGRSGARGKDLILPGGGHAEIKTCYRVDQLGSCKKCSAVVASVELECPACGSDDVTRKDDSKWLISPKHDTDMGALFEPQSYYLVLFDFVDLHEPSVINARIYDVNPRTKGFAYCLVDYYFNIKANSASGAPFNLWPFSLKFQLMEPVLIYHAQIDSSDAIDTLIFPGERGNPKPVVLDPLTSFSRASGFTLGMVHRLASVFSVPLDDLVSKAEGLRILEERRSIDGWDNAALVEALCEAMYGDLLGQNRSWLPADLQ